MIEVIRKEENGFIGIFQLETVKKAATENH